MTTGSLFHAARQRADSLLRMAGSPGTPVELPSDLPYVQATEYMALAEATDRLVAKAKGVLSAPRHTEQWHDAADELARELRWFGA